jgi:hypothetical protein
MQSPWWQLSTTLVKPRDKIGAFAGRLQGVLLPIHGLQLAAQNAE